MEASYFFNLYRAMAFLKLVNDVDGTAVRDGTHDLVVRVILLQVSHNFLNLAYSRRRHSVNSRAIIVIR